MLAIIYITTVLTKVTPRHSFTIRINVIQYCTFIIQVASLQSFGNSEHRPAYDIISVIYLSEREDYKSKILV